MKKYWPICIAKTTELKYLYEEILDHDDDCISAMLLEPKKAEYMIEDSIATTIHRFDFVTVPDTLTKYFQNFSNRYDSLTIGLTISSKHPFKYEVEDLKHQVSVSNITALLDNLATLDPYEYEFKFKSQVNLEKTYMDTYFRRDFFNLP